MTAPDRRQVSLGPGLPRFDLEPLDLPAPKAGERCWLCLGRKGSEGPDGAWIACEPCDGTGQIGGAE